MSLPLPLVDSLFARMLVRYGAGWTRMWEGIAIDAVKADWADQLDRVPEYAILYGLDYLPLDRPPTASAFRALCAAAPIPSLPRLTEPKPTEEQKARASRIVADLKHKLAQGRVL